MGMKTAKPARRRAEAARRGRPALDRERIAAAALALADRDGLGALSMRALGAELGVEAMSLYKHVDGKQAVLDSLVDAALGPVDWRARGDADWRARVEHVAGRLREVALAHPSAFAVLASGVPRSPAARTPMLEILAALADGGMAPGEAASAFWSILAWVLGSVACEAADPNGEAAGAWSRWMGADETGTALRPFIDARAACEAGSDFTAGLARLLRAAPGG